MNCLNKDMVCHKSMNVRLYPSVKQQKDIRQIIGCSRFIYNQMLAERKEFYKLNKDDKRLLKNHKYKTIKEYKEEHKFLDYADYQALNQSKINLEAAYKNFYSGRTDFPTFHKKGHKKKYHTDCINNNIRFDYNNHKLKLPKLRWVKYVDDRRIPDNCKIKSVTVSISNGDYFYASVLYEYEKQEKNVILPENPKVKGLDMSFSEFYKDSDGNTPGYKRNYRSNENKQVRLQKKLVAQKKGSNRYRITKAKLSRLYEHTKNSRKAFIEETSTRLVRNNDVIVVESLNLNGMKESKMKGYGKSVSDLGWGMFVRRLSDKCSEQGKILVKADKWFASSKTCSCCGCVLPELNISTREWVCPSCGEIHNRDHNAAQNLRNVGYKYVSEQITEPVATPGIARSKTEGHTPWNENETNAYSLTG